jgi:hypothetical protein
VKFRHLAFILFALIAFPALALACACTSSAPGQCPGLQPTDVVFTGTVTDVQYVPPDQAAPTDISQTTEAPVGGDLPSSTAATPPATPAPAQIAPGTSSMYRYHFHIDERFAGPADQQEVDVYSGGEDGDCAYRFKPGAQYVVYTQAEDDGRLFATICSGTRPVADAAALIPQLRAMRDGRRVAAVFGVLRRSDPPFLSPPDDPAEPIPNISLKLRSQLDRFQSNSGSDGVYNFYDVHDGTYNFTANLPPGTELTQKSQAVPLEAFSIPDGACYEYDVYALPTGHIGGSVLGPDGKPLPIATLELYRAGTYDDSRPGYWGFQGATGAFDFDHVGPGEYILVYNRANRMDPNSPFPRSFYPGVHDIADAKPIELKDSQDLEKLVFNVDNGYSSRTLRVRVKFTGPRPAGSVTIAAAADKHENPSVNKIAEGVYGFTMFGDANYTVSAWEDLTPQRSRGKNACAMPARIEAAPVTISGSDPTKEITLTFPKPSCAKQ